MAGDTISRTRLGAAARNLSVDEVCAAVRTYGTPWDAAVNFHAREFFRPFIRMGIHSAADGRRSTFVRRRPLPRVAQLQYTGADLPLDTARTFAAIVQDPRHALIFVDTARPIDMFQVGEAKRLEDNGYLCYTVLVPHSDSAPDVVDLTVELVERSLKAYRWIPTSIF